MARVTQPKIQMKIYRHFAVVTIVLTLGIAVFADGESREAIQAEGPSQPATVAKPKPAPTLVRSRSSGGFASDAEVSGSFGADVAMGSATDGDSERGSSSGIIPDELPDDATTATALAAGYPPHVLAEMSAAEREQLVKSLREAGIQDSADREARTASLLASSRQRSGGVGESGLF